MKRIILTVTNDLTYDQRMIRICGSLFSAGYEVMLVGRTKKNSIPLGERPFQQHRLNCRMQKGKLFYLEFNLRLLFFLLRQRMDILCAIDLDTILPAFVVSKIKGVTLVYDAHEYFTEVPEVVDRPMVKSVWETLAQLTIPNIKYAYTVGEGLATIFEEKYGTAFGVIRNVPFQKELSVQSGQEPKIILYQGVLNEGRGLEAVMRAMKYIEGAVLWLVGEGDLSHVLRKLKEQLALSDKVVFWGYLRPEELAELTPKAYIGLNLLENKGLSYYYSLANKAFDYIQAGIPSIQMNFPEYAALNTTYDIFQLVDDLATDQLVSAIQLLINDKAHYDRLRHNCLLAREELTWEKEAVKLIDFYKKL